MNTYTSHFLYKAEAFIIIALFLFLQCVSVHTKAYAADASPPRILRETEDSDYKGTLMTEDEYFRRTGMSAKFSGGKSVYLGDEDSYCNFTVAIEIPGYYILALNSCGVSEEIKIPVEIDGTILHENGEWLFFDARKEYFAESEIEKEYYFTKGEHTITLGACYAVVDYFSATLAEAMDGGKYFDTDYPLSNPNASRSAKRLFSFIQSNYGKKIISGQQTAKGYSDPVFQKIRQKTGKLPAMIGLDLKEYSSAIAQHQKDNTIGYAAEYAKMGGIVTFCWHWIAPETFLKKDENGKTDEESLWNGYRSWAVDMDLQAVMNDADSEGYKALMGDIDLIAKELQRLSDADVPVLFRPLHEASGAWFWWGNYGAEAYIELWRAMYDKLTYEYKLNNLIWVWNGQSKEWYPGDNYVDVVGEDIYSDPKDYGDRVEKFAEALKYSETPKITALTETGTLFDIDRALEDGAMWSWFLTWNWKHAIPDNYDSETILAWEDGLEYEVQTELYMWEKVYRHEKVITLSDSPFHEHTDNDSDKACDLCGDAVKGMAEEQKNPDPPWLIIVVILSVALSAFLSVSIILGVKLLKNHRRNGFK